MMFESAWLIMATVSIAVLSSENTGPRLEMPHPEVGYHGLVKENERLVEVRPKIRVTGGSNCSFRIVNKHHGEAPFEVRLVDKELGEAELYAKKDLNCEKRKNYKFDIAAVCNGVPSNNATVHVSVIDVNEYEPTFVESAYVIDVDEGRLYENIIQVEAEDEDCSPKFGDICKYEILNSDQPFIIDLDGKIRNTEPLDWEKSHNHILSVVAYDCGMKRSKNPVLVTIKVKRVCRLGWKDMDERIEYVPGSGTKMIFPQAHLELCEVPCSIDKLSTKFTLTTRHIGKGCDRDTYSVESQRKLCGASSDSIDLLPTPGLGSEWTKTLPTDDGHEADQIYEFDGRTNAVVIPASTLDHNLTNTFTFSLWMKHAGGGPGSDMHSHIKESIICNADDHKMSRPHYNLFVRNCRLIFLLRRDYTEENPNTFRPAEWRWKMPQVCDDEWHHYAVNVVFPEVTLYVDGQKFPSTEKNPEIIDDWPLHPTKGLNTTLVVGACWQGAENKMGHYFRGFLAGLSVLRNKTEKPEVVSCLHHCKESLESPGVELLEPGMQLLKNNDVTEVTVEGNNKTNLETLVRRVGYVNSREFPTPGRRNVQVTTSVLCTSGKSVKVPVVESYITVLQREQPIIAISGTSEVCKYVECSHGVKIFSSVSISVSKPGQASLEEETSTKRETDEEHLRNSLEHKLDSCTIFVHPPLNHDHEYFRMPENEMAELGIKYQTSKDGIVISGTDMIYNYEDILRHIHYANRKPAYYLNRNFKLVCSELNGRFLSNEYVQTLSVVHPQVEKAAKSAAVVAHAKVDRHHVEFSADRKNGETYLESNLLDTSEVVAMSSASHTVTIIIVVCVGFLVFMIVLGVIRIRAAHHRSQDAKDEDQEMAWDDSSLTITVNPMDQIEGEDRETRPLNDEDDSDSSDDGSCSYHDENDSCSEEEPETKTKGGRGELEWDDSTLTY